MHRRIKRRGISFGTIIMLLLMISVIVGCILVFPKIAGNDVQVDPQVVVDAITAELDLPELKLADIPVFQTQTKDATATNVPSLPATEPLATDREGMEVIPMETIAAGGMAEITVTQLPQAVTQTPVKETPAPTKAPSRYSFTITAGGTAAFESSIRDAAYYKESETYDYSEMFSLLSQEIQADDLRLVTLQNTIAQSKKLSDLNVTGDALDALGVLGVDMVALGHKKVLDSGAEALNETIQAVKAKGISIIGAYGSSADSTLILNLNGAQVAVLHYTQALSSTGKKQAKKLDYSAVPLGEIETISKDIAAAKGAGAQVVVVSLNWGTTDKNEPNKAQQQLAQQLADAGADVILGSGSQRVQAVEYLTGNRGDGSQHQTLVAYSLGALVTESRDTANISGMLLQLKMTYDEGTKALAFDQVTYTPTYIWRYKSGGQYQYRVVASDSAAPDAMDDKQKGVMIKALEWTQKALSESVATKRTAGQ